MPVRKCRGFTLLELLTSCAILMLMVAVLAKLMGSTSDIWIRQRGNSAAFEGANAAFERLTRALAQATLNTYWGYDNPAHPSSYLRQSELHFDMGPASLLLGKSGDSYPGTAAFFQAPLGKSMSGNSRNLPFLLNALGYFVGFNQSASLPTLLGSRIDSKWRFRLYEWLQPTEDMTVYNDNSTAWFKADVTKLNENCVVIADNIIGIVLMAEYPSGTGTVSSYVYDSRDSSNRVSVNQLPPKIRILMAAIDETSAKRLADKYGNAPPPLAPPSQLFQIPSSFDSDVNEWERALQSVVPKPNYHFYVATVTIQNAKWSVSQQQ